jgi:hypothetical protein
MTIISNVLRAALAHREVLFASRTSKIIQICQFARQLSVTLTLSPTDWQLQLSERSIHRLLPV